MSADLLREDYSESIVQGFIQTELIRVYQVITENREDKPSQVLQEPGLPPLGQPAIIATTGSPVWCTSRVPTREQTSATEKYWAVTCKFTNFTQQFERNQNGDPVSDPSEAVKRVDVQYVEYQEPVTDALFRIFTQGGPVWESGSTEITPNPPWFPALLTRGPVGVSNGRPVEVFRSAYRKVISVSQVFRDWSNSWDNYVGKLNSDTVTIEERDSEGVRWSETYAPLTLRMRPPNKENIWKDAKLYYRRTMTMEHNPNTWIHSELDADTKRRIFVGQYKPGSGQYTQQDLDRLNIEGDWGFQEITTLDEDGTQVAIGNPVALNGYGMEQPVSRNQSYTPNQPFYGNWDIYREIAFAPLSL